MKGIKNIYRKAIVAAGVIGITASCTLDLKPETTWTPDNFYKNESEINIALAGIYGNIKSGNVLGGNLLLMDYGTDEGYASKGWTENYPSNLYTMTETTQDVESAWRTIYQGINNANSFIKYIQPEKFEEIEDYNRYLGEAHFLRAYMYYLLTTWWNEVPLRLEPTVDQSDNHMAAASTTEIYMQIIADLEFAAENLTSAYDEKYIAGHANAMAAHAMLAKIYMKAAGYPARLTEINGKEPYQAAKEHLSVIIDSGEHGLIPSEFSTVKTADGLKDSIVVTKNGYKELFLNYIQNKYDYSESIFEIVFSNGTALGVSLSGQLGNRIGLQFKPNPRIEVPYSDPEVSPSPIFEDKYTDWADPEDPAFDPSLEKDIRKNWNIPAISASAKGKINTQATPLTWAYGIGKFRRWEPVFPDDIPASNAVTPSMKVLETPEPLTANSTGINLPVIRYADVLLMYAEVVNQMDGPTADAQAKLDMVRQRAGLNPIATSNAGAVASKEAFMLEIVDERFRELCFEGQRKADLVRWGLLEDKVIELGVSITSQQDYDAPSHGTKLRAVNNFDPGKHLSLPYPQQEVLINQALDQKAEW